MPISCLHGYNKLNQPFNHIFHDGFHYVGDDSYVSSDLPREIQTVHNLSIGKCVTKGNVV